MGDLYLYHHTLIRLISHPWHTCNGLQVLFQLCLRFVHPLRLSPERVLLVLLGKLYPPLVLTQLRWVFPPNTGGSASTKILSWVSKLTQPLPLRLARRPPQALIAPRLHVLVDPRIGGATSVIGGCIISYVSEDESFSGGDSSFSPGVEL